MTIITIEKIQHTKEEKEKELREREEREKYSKLVEEFNKKAEELNIPYLIEITYNYPHLFVKKPTFFFPNKKIKFNQISYNQWEDKFSFIDGLDYNVFKDIEQILNKIDIKFEIKLKDGKIPSKYGIMNALK